MSLRKWALLFGVLFILAGIAGFMPMFTPNGKLLGIFQVDPMHNWIHLVSGIVALLAMSKRAFAKLYFIVFGIIYGLVAISGFVYPEHMMMMQMNMADHLLHIVIAVVALYVGFTAKASA